METVTISGKGYLDDMAGLKIAAEAMGVDFTVSPERIRALISTAETFRDQYRKSKGIEVDDGQFWAGLSLFGISSLDQTT